MTESGPLANRPSRVRSSLAAAGVRPTKSRGQNFLVQAAVANRIVDAAQLSRDDSVVEIGPGLGILSERIAATPIARLALIELEQGLAEELERRFAGDRRVRVINADFLRTDFELIPDRAPFKVIGNLPFNAAAAILARLCERRGEISRMVLMFQREVADRIRARVGDPSYGALTVYTSLYFSIESHFRVGAGNFHPRPNVDATVLVFQPRAKMEFLPEEERAVLDAIRAGFSAPRKTLRNSIAHGRHLPASEAENALRRAEIDPGARAETLSGADFIRLARALPAMLADSDA